MVHHFRIAAQRPESQSEWSDQRQPVDAGHFILLGPGTRLQLSCTNRFGLLLDRCNGQHVRKSRGLRSDGRRCIAVRPVSMRQCGSLSHSCRRSSHFVLSEHFRRHLSPHIEHRFIAVSHLPDADQWPRRARPGRVHGHRKDHRERDQSERNARVQQRERRHDKLHGRFEFEPGLPRASELFLCSRRRARSRSSDHHEQLE